MSSPPGSAASGHPMAAPVCVVTGENTRHRWDTGPFAVLRHPLTDRATFPPRTRYPHCSPPSAGRHPSLPHAQLPQIRLWLVAASSQPSKSQPLTGPRSQPDPAQPSSASHSIKQGTGAGAVAGMNFVTQPRSSSRGLSSLEG